MSDQDVTQAKTAPVPSASPFEVPDTLTDWLLLRPVTRMVRAARMELRAAAYLRRTTSEIDPAGAELHLRQAIIGTIAFNRPDLTEWQIHLMRRHVAQGQGYVVFDNSPSPDARQRIRAVCARHGVPYVGLPANIFQGMTHSKVLFSHAGALNWACRNFIARFKPALFGFLDHDIFPTRPFDLADRLREHPAYGLRMDSPPGVGTWGLWPGYCFFRGSDVDVTRLNFNPSFRFKLPTGGRNWPVLRDLAQSHTIAFAERDWLRLGSGSDIHESFFEMIDGWVHPGNATAWRGPDLMAQRQGALQAMLRAAAGDNPPAVEIQPL